ncbi:MAG: methionine--tRNA ligase [bacterium]|nr:methionine--tRNA ligase [bacterium]
MSNKYFITTAIPYVNANPHLGHALELVQGDALARYQHNLGKEVWFLNGTDENALKNVQSAEKAGEEVRPFVDRYAETFRKLSKTLHISNDDFIRTTEERHVKGAQKLWQACAAAGDIYKKKYKGLYCVGCETFYTEKDLLNGLCPEHKTKPEEIEEENYFFKLAKYQKEIYKLIKSDELKIIPSSKKNELLSFIDQGLEDFSISRSRERAKDWGIPVPGDDSQIIYVWFDALSNYINAIGYGTDEARFKAWWQENLNTAHVIGKGITRFHAIYWPGMLLSAGLALPKTIYVHGYLTIDGEKISKSLGNVIDPFEVVKKYGVDPVRYFLLREIPSGEDGDFSYKKLEDRYQADLANGLGNLVQRVLTLIENGLLGEVNYLSNLEDLAVQEAIVKSRKKYDESFEDFRLHEALGAIFDLVGFANSYVNEHKPWELVKIHPVKSSEAGAPKAQFDGASPEHFLKVMINLVRLNLEIALWLKPFLPETADKILESFGFTGKDLDHLDHQKLVIKKGAGLFPRLG